MRPPRLRKLVSLALGLGIFACLWFYFAPAGLGGKTSYVVTDGVSMQPRFHTGDLAIVRSQSSYRVGEIAAYYSKAFHTVVLHRIVGRAGARYVFKGDNNGFVDFEHPAASQLIGSLWIHIPGAGAHLESVRSPALIGVLVAFGTLLLTGGVFSERRRRRRRRERADAREAAVSAPARPQRSLGPLAGVLALFALALIPFVLLGLLAFTRASSTRLPFRVDYEQNGTLSYSAHARPGPTYANNLAVTGDPLFSHVLSTVDVRFSYEFNAPAAHSLVGAASLYALVSSSSGWQTTFELGHPAHFRGDHALVRAPLDLTSLLALVRSVEDTTGVEGSYTLTLLPRVSAGGSVGTLPLHTTFTPDIHFTLTPLELQPAVANASALGGAQPPTNQFTPTASGTVTGKRSQPLFLSFGVGRMAVATARAVALAGIALIVLFALAAVVFVRPREREEAAVIRSRYGRLIVSVARVWPLPGVAIIDVTDMDALARIAEHYDRSILHETGEPGDAYWVTDESGQFRYAPGAAPATHETDSLARAAAAAERIYEGAAHEVIEEEIYAAAPTAPATDPTEEIYAAVPADDPAGEIYTAAPTAPANDPAGEIYAAALSTPASTPTEETYAVLPAALTGEPVEDVYAAALTRPAGDVAKETHAAPLSEPADEVYMAAFAPQNGGSAEETHTVAFPTQNGSSAGEAHTTTSATQNGSLAEEARTAELGSLGDGPVEEVYADEFELGVIGYESRRNGRPNRSNTSPSLPAWTGSSG